jgi:dihydropteroate synthase
VYRSPKTGRPEGAALLRGAALHSAGRTLAGSLPGGRAACRAKEATIRFERKHYRIRIRGEERVLGPRTWVMGVLNLTPDSFSDGGRYADADAALRQGLALFEAGADIVDVGGESTRPAAAPVSAAEETSRVVPAIRALRQRAQGLISVDTTKVEVARAALDAGADLVNDVSGFRFDPEMADLVAQRGVPAVVMHLRGRFATMHERPHYRDVAAEVVEELASALDRAEARGVPRQALIVDPGIGFSKDADHSLEMLKRLRELARLDRPLLVGPSRKSFLGKLLDVPVGERLLGTAAAVAASVLAGAHVVRVHDVREMVQVARVCDALLAEAA